MVNTNGLWRPRRSYLGGVQFACRTSTQSFSPRAFFPGVVKVAVPEFGKGFARTALDKPEVGSNHSAKTGWCSAVISTVMLAGDVRVGGTYAMSALPSAVAAETTKFVVE